MILKIPYKCPECRDPLPRVKVERESEGHILSRGLDTAGEKPIRFYTREVKDRYKCENCGHEWILTGLEEVSEESDIE